MKMLLLTLLGQSSIYADDVDRYTTFADGEANVCEGKTGYPGEDIYADKKVNACLAFSFQTFHTGPDVTRLPAELCPGGDCQEPVAQWCGANADGTDWDATYGSDLTAAGSGGSFAADGPYGTGTTVDGAGSRYYTGTAIDLDTDDWVFEITGYLSATATVVYFDQRDGTDEGVEIQSNSSGQRLQLVVEDEGGDTQTVQSPNSLSDGWAHLMVSFDAGGQAYITHNAVAGAGGDVSSIDDLTTDADLGVLARHGGTFFAPAVTCITVWQRPAGWLDNSDETQIEAIALARMKALAGVETYGTSAESWTRAGAAYQHDASGNPFLMGDNWPRFEERYCSGLWSEPARTNTLQYSDDLTQTWTEIDTGDTTAAQSLTADSTDGAHGVAQAITLTAATWSCSVEAKAGDQDWLFLEDTTVTHSSYFDLTDCSAGTTDTVTQTFGQALADSWCIVGFSFTGTAAPHTIRVRTAESNEDATFAGDGATVNTEIRHLQCELGPYPSSRIDTAGSSAARALDENEAVMTTALGAEWTVDATFQHPWDFENEADNLSWLYLEENGVSSMTYRVRINDKVDHLTSPSAGDPGLISYFVPDVTDGAVYTLRTTFTEDSVRGYHNGTDTGQLDTSADLLSDVTDVHLGHRGGIEQPGGCLSAISVWATKNLGAP